jgi:DNA repair exonuclease SbcCD ATPase subunit
MKINLSLDKLNQLQNKINLLNKYSINVSTFRGYKKIKAIGITSPNSFKINIKTNEFNLSGSPKHRVKYLDRWIFLKDIKVGSFVNTKNGPQEIISVYEDNNREDLWDIEVEGSEYFSNGILSHNSSLLESFEYCLYGKVKSGRTRKWSKLSSLPNRINGELKNSIKFQSLNTEVEVKRGINPNILELWENGILNERAGKGNIDVKIENYIGMDIETFKSFISMSINDFKNFISLSTEEKQILLDKLFNLEVINILNSILKELNKNNKNRIISLDSEISTLNESIESIQTSIDKAIEKEKENTQSEIDAIKAEMDSKKEDYLLIKEKIDKIKIKESEVNSELEKEKTQYITIQNDIRGVQKDIDLYDSGKCPTCKTDFDSQHFISLKSTLVDKKKSLDSIKSEVEDNIKNIKSRQEKLKGISDSANKTYTDITYFLKNSKNQIEKLQQKQNKEDKPSENILEFEKTILNLNNRKSSSNENISLCKEKESYYKELNKIFGEDGVKKSIISGIVKPINFFISENLRKMGVRFEVSLDETFTAEIRNLGTIIDPDSLSTGENRRINVSILISYLMLIRTKKSINILFLDEVFSSVDIQGVNDILLILKDFAVNYNINIFVVHHAIINEEIFDRVLRINKEIFSSIEEVEIQ